MFMIESVPTDAAMARPEGNLKMFVRGIVSRDRMAVLRLVVPILK